MVLFYTWGGVLGQVIPGAIFDRWATYQPLLWCLIGVFIVAGLFCASLNRRRKRRAEVRQSRRFKNNHPRTPAHNPAADTSTFLETWKCPWPAACRYFPVLTNWTQFP